MTIERYHAEPAPGFPFERVRYTFDTLEEIEGALLALLGETYHWSGYLLVSDRSAGGEHRGYVSATRQGKLNILQTVLWSAECLRPGIDGIRLAEIVAQHKERLEAETAGSAGP